MSGMANPLISTSAAKLSNNNYMNNKNSLLNDMLDAYQSNPKLIKQPVFKVLDAKAKADSKKIDDAYAKLMKKLKKSKRELMLKKLIKPIKNQRSLMKRTQRINKAYKKLMKPVTVTKLDKALNGAARSYEVDITNGKDPLKVKCNEIGPGLILT